MLAIKQSEIIRREIIDGVFNEDSLKYFIENELKPHFFDYHKIFLCYIIALFTIETT
jgi:hypothetical protein